MELLRLIDQLAETNKESRVSALLDRIAFTFMVIMVVAAPHSIAATQTAWLVGMTAWVVRQFIRPRPRFRVTAVGLALLAFFAWSIVSASLSYEAAVSLDKIRAVAVLFIFFYVLNVVRNVRAAHLLAFALIGSCMVNVLWMPIQRMLGRGVEVHGIEAAGPLGIQGIKDGDAIVRVDGKKINEPDAILEDLKTKPSVRLDVYRLDALFFVNISKAEIPAVGSPETRLGFTSWNRSRNFRAVGFYGHYTTYAEVLQLIGSLAFGLLVAAYMAGTRRSLVAGLAVCVAGIVIGLLFTATRASQLAFIISSGLIALLGTSRKIVMLGLAAALPLALLGLYILQQQRQVGFFDRKDGSIQYREMMWRDGLRLWSDSPRHMVVGVGMDSVKTHWAEWGMYDKGHQPMGHFHSTPVQLLVERGLPALAIWLIVVGLFAYYLFGALRRTDGDWRTRGILLGCLGGAAVGFFASGLVHWNLGDTEVAMVVFVLMGFSMRLAISEPESILADDSPLLATSDISVNSSPDN